MAAGITVLTTGRPLPVAVVALDQLAYPNPTRWGADGLARRLLLESGELRVEPLQDLMVKAASPPLSPARR